MDVGDDLPHAEDRRLIGRQEVDLQPTNPLTLWFMKYVWQTKKCVSKSDRDLDSGSQRGFNLAPWRIFGQIGLSISASCTDGTMAASGPEPRWSAPQVGLSAAATSAHCAVVKSETRATHGYTPSPKRWVYLLQRGWRKMKVKALRMRVS